MIRGTGTVLPKRLRTSSRRETVGRLFPAHRAWVRGHACCVPGCPNPQIECAHVRRETDGGGALKPSDFWTISLCGTHHAEQHAIGEARFEKRHAIDMRELALAFARRSPHRAAWRGAYAHLPAPADERSTS